MERPQTFICYGLPMNYFDAHCHVQFDAYDADRDAVLTSMRDAGIGGLIVGTDRTTSAKAIETADGETFFATVGLHPNDKPQEGYDDAVYRTLAADPKVVAIGECGLDYYRPLDPENEKTRQKDAFAKQIELAAEIDMPLMIHARPSKGTMDAYRDAIEMIKEAKARHGERVRGNMHFFVGDTEVARELLSLGFTFSFTAVLTFTPDYDEVVRFLPLEAILSETDAPYVAPAPNRGKRNDPLAVREVVKALARIRGVEEEEVRAATIENAKRLFRL
jgi:TatD DNase family protein